MIELGKSLREARERKGYTINQLAEMTHMVPSRIDDIENEDFSKIAAPIYGRGFIKLYCEAVGIEPKEYIDEFMAIYNGEREAVIHEMPEPVEPAVEPAPAPEPMPMTPSAEPEPDPMQAPAPVQEPMPMQEPAPVPEPPAEPVVSQSPAADEASFSRYSTPFKQSYQSTSMFSDKRLWRICALSIGGLIVLWLMISGIRMLYHATTSAPVEQEPQAEAVSQPIPKTETPKPATKTTTSKKSARTAQKIPSLYID